MERLKNFGRSTLAAALSNSATSLTVTDATKFPGAGNFRLKIDDELVLVTAVSGATFTVTRGVESTTAAAHSSGTRVEAVLTAAALTQVLAEAIATALVDYATSAELTTLEGAVDDVEADVAQLDSDLDQLSTDTSAALALKAPLASPALTGTPTGPTATLGTNTTQLATTAFVKAAIDALVAAAPGVLDTLDELAAALGDDANFATTITNAIAAKLDASSALANKARNIIAPSGTPTYNYITSRSQSIILGASATLTVSNPVDGVPAVLFLQQGGSGSYTVTWPASFRWSGGAAPTLSTAVGKLDVVTFVYHATLGIYVASAILDITP